MADHAQVPQYRARAAPRRICRRLAGELHPLNRPRRRARAIDSSRFCTSAAIVLSRIGSKARVVAGLTTNAGTDMKFLLPTGTDSGLCSSPAFGQDSMCGGSEAPEHEPLIHVGPQGYRRKASAEKDEKSRKNEQLT